MFTKFFLVMAATFILCQFPFVSPARAELNQSPFNGDWELMSDDCDHESIGAYIPCADGFRDDKITTVQRLRIQWPIYPPATYPDLVLDIFAVEEEIPGSPRDRDSRPTHDWGAKQGFEGYVRFFSDGVTFTATQDVVGQNPSKNRIYGDVYNDTLLLYTYKQTSGFTIDRRMEFKRANP